MPLYLDILFEKIYVRFHDKLAKHNIKYISRIKRNETFQNLVRQTRVFGVGYITSSVLTTPKSLKEKDGRQVSADNKQPTPIHTYRRILRDTAAAEIRHGTPTYILASAGVHHRVSVEKRIFKGLFFSYKTLKILIQFIEMIHIN